MSLLVLRAGDEERAAQMLRDLYTIERRGAFGAYHRAPWIEYLLLRGRFEEALSAARETAELDAPLAPIVGAALEGEALLALGRNDEARAALERARAAAAGIASVERGNLFEQILPGVSWRYLDVLDALIVLYSGDVQTGGKRLLQHAASRAAGRNIDIWAGGAFRTETFALYASRLGHSELAQALEAYVAQVWPEVVD